ncbi:MAG TPA: hypothetical protein VNE62_07820 [Actinomycetota bacterium]|nr:hypothetical protein [Actinomycetota bacterium]
MKVRLVRSLSRMAPPWARSAWAVVRSLFRRLIRLAPPMWRAWLAFHLKKSSRSAWGGPFNGQSFRRRIFLDLLRTLSPQAIVETGTHRGTTTAFLAEQSGLPVHTVEADAGFFHYSRLRLREHPNVNLALGDSRGFLRSLSADSDFPKGDVFFYLDAHWSGDLPLSEEVEVIAGCWKRAVVMIDDFEVPGDSGYGFDDYGHGKRLALEYLGPPSRFGMTAFFPTATSAQEDGWKRGCVVLVTDDLVEQVRGITSLRALDSGAAPDS